MRILAKPSALVLVMIQLTIGLAMLSGAATVFADEPTGISVYDESAYTDYVQNTMKELDKLYLQFCNTCGSQAAKAAKAREEFLVKARELMQYMNGRFDKLDPKMGAALSPTESLVSIHALTMLVDILAATEMEHLQQHPYIE